MTTKRTEDRSGTNKKQISEESFRLLVESVTDYAIFMLDPHGHIATWNAGASRIKGYTADEIVGRHFSAFYPSEDNERGKPEYELEVATAEGRFEDIGWRIRKDGSRFWANVVITALRDENGELRGFGKVTRDLTERKRAEQIAESEERYRTLAEALPQLVWTCIPSGQCDYLSQQWVEYTGRSEREQLGFKWLDVVHPDDRARAMDSWMAAVNHGADYDLEFRIRRADGAYRWFKIRGVSIRDVDGQVIKWLGTCTDIEDQKQAEKAAREEARVTEILRRAGAAMAAELDAQRLVQVLTDEATALCGAEFGSYFYNVVNQAGESYVLYTLSGAPREAFDKFPMPRNTEVFGPTFRGEGVVRSDDITRDPRYGKSAPYHGMPPGHLPVRSYLAVPVISRGGEVLGGLFFGHPQTGVFTERAERAVQAMASQAAVALENARLFQAERERSEQLAQAVREVHHRVKNNLQAVTSLLQMQIDEGGESVPASALRNSLRQIKTIAFVHDLLSRDHPIGEVDASLAIRSLLALVSTGAGTPEGPVRITLEVESVLLPTKAATALALTVNELVTNAIKHGRTGHHASEKSSGDGNGAIDVRLWKAEGLVHLVVRDNGPGFPPGFDASAHANIGLDLVNALVRSDLQGRLDFGSGSGAMSESPVRGGRVELVFPERPHSE